MTAAARSITRRACLRAAAAAACCAAPWAVRAQPGGVDALRAGLARELAGPEQRIRAMAVQRDGEVLFEYHRPGLRPDAWHDVRSVTKSVVSLLAGAAIAQGRLGMPDQPLAGLLAEAADPAQEPGVRALTWAHCLSLATGYAPVAPVESSDYGRFLEWFHRADGLALSLRRPFAHAPGARWHYSNADSQIAGLVVVRAIGRTAPPERGEGQGFLAWARETLLAPIGAADAAWTTNSTDLPNCAAGLHLRLRDLLALGQVVVDQGRWQGRQIVDAAYLAQATQRRIDTTHPLRGGFIGYGWLWWVAPTPDGADSATYAVGYGGQYIYVVPARRIVLAATSEVGDAVHARGSARTGRLLRDWALPLALASAR